MDFNKAEFLKMEKNWITGQSQDSITSVLVAEIRYLSTRDVLLKVKGLLNALHALEFQDWDSDKKVVFAIPNWFADFCVTPHSDAEMKSWLAQWRALTGEKQLAFEEKKGWSLQDWLYWMHPRNRTWYVVSAVDGLELRSKLVVAVSSWPTPLGAAKWMLRAAGAAAIEIVE